jgi:uncharacterized protein YndB with AHSA1/START domain
MKLIKRLLILVVVLILGVIAAGWLLPSHYSVERAIVSQAKPEKLYDIVADLKTWEDWTAWNKQLDPTITRTFAGPASGAGSSMAWDGKKTGQGEFKFTDATPPGKIVYALSFEHGKYLSTGVFTFETNPKGTVVRWTNEGDLGLNPISRWMGLFMDRLMGDDFAKGLTELKARAEAK